VFSSIIYELLVGYCLGWSASQYFICRLRVFVCLKFSAPLTLFAALQMFFNRLRLPAFFSGAGQEFSMPCVDSVHPPCMPLVRRCCLNGWHWGTLSFVQVCITRLCSQLWSLSFFFVTFVFKTVFFFLCSYQLFIRSHQVVDIDFRKIRFTLTGSTFPEYRLFLLLRRIGVFAFFLLCFPPRP